MQAKQVWIPGFLGVGQMQSGSSRLEALKCDRTRLCILEIRYVYIYMCVCVCVCTYIHQCLVRTIPYVHIISMSISPGNSTVRSTKKILPIEVRNFERQAQVPALPSHQDTTGHGDIRPCGRKAQPPFHHLRKQENEETAGRDVWMADLCINCTVWYLNIYIKWILFMSRPILKYDHKNATTTCSTLELIITT